MIVIPDPPAVALAEEPAVALCPAAGALAAGVLLLVLLPHAAASSVVPSSTLSFTGSGARVSNEMLILFVSCLGRYGPHIRPPLCSCFRGNYGESADTA